MGVFTGGGQLICGPIPGSKQIFTFWEGRMAKKLLNDMPRAPRHLRAATRGWFDSIVEAYHLESHQVRLLVLAAEAWDGGEQARESLAKFGTTYTDRFGSPRARPECAQQRDCRLAFARLLRELSLDVDAPTDAPRPPSLRYSGRAR
jgi:hypothetical protein